MINQSRQYRIFKATAIFCDRDDMRIYQTDTTIDLGDVGSYERYPYDTFKDYGECTTLFFTNNKPPITIRTRYKDFADKHERYLSDINALDNKSQKKTLNYKGMMRAHHVKGTQYHVTTFYPRGLLFTPQMSEQDIQDSILLNEIRPLN